jgi:ribonuclease III
MDNLEERIGYKFRNSLLLAEALTHPSLAYETNKPHFDNQRLEFLGDAVLQLILTRELFERFPEFEEGRLTKLRSRLVSKQALAGFAEDLNLGNFLLLGKGEEAGGGRLRHSSLADAFEALVGALYLDGGYPVVRTVVLRAAADALQELEGSPVEVNPKGELQEILQAFSQEAPRYEIISQEGPDHDKRFVSKVIWEGENLGVGEGRSKKEAETRAAAKALQHAKVKTLQAGEGM